jgi:hypothetical protein
MLGFANQGRRRYLLNKGKMDHEAPPNDPDDPRPDGRRHKRVTLLREIACQGDAGTIRSETGDISAGGMFIDSARAPFPQGETVTVAFLLSPAEPRITARAEVQYIQDGIGMGVRFLDLSQEDVDRVERFVEWVISRKQAYGDPNLRKSSRVSITIPVTVRMSVEGIDIEEEASIMTLSRHGACLLTNSEVGVGMKLLLSMRNGREFKGNVVWVGDPTTKTNGHVGIQCRGLAQAMGFQFP